MKNNKNLIASIKGNRLRWPFQLSIVVLFVIALLVVFHGASPSTANIAVADQLEASQADGVRTGAEYGRLPLSFEANHGQTNADVQFLSRGAGYTLFLMPTKAVLSLESGSRDRHENTQIRP